MGVALPGLTSLRSVRPGYLEGEDLRPSVCGRNGCGVVAPKGAPSFIMGGIHNLRAATRHLDVATVPVASKEARAATQQAH